MLLCSIDLMHTYIRTYVEEFELYFSGRDEISHWKSPRLDCISNKCHFLRLILACDNDSQTVKGYVKKKKKKHFDHYF